ncbi:hypothetical protein VTH82DRAFT_1617 [Thermothelomyces myriococcoides]
MEYGIEEEGPSISLVHDVPHLCDLFGAFPELIKDSLLTVRPSLPLGLHLDVVYQASQYLSNLQVRLRFRQTDSRIAGPQPWGKTAGTSVGRGIGLCAAPG